MRIAHIVNPVMASNESDLRVAQPITFESMRVARDSTKGDVEIRLLSAQYAEDCEAVPDWLDKTPDLDRSVLDEGVFRLSRKLPLLRNILGRAYDASEDYDYLIYTNVDIGLMPFFYQAVAQMLRKGYDGLVINRRTIDEQFTKVEDLALIYSSVGEKHPGYDCFVFRRNAFTQYELGKICIGAPMVGTLLLLNIACAAERFAVLEDSHMTFHIGDTRVWQNSQFDEYAAHNVREGYCAIAELEARWGPLSDHPNAGPYVPVRKRRRSLLGKLRAFLGGKETSV